MNILVATNHLVNTGGTECYSYALIIEILKKGHCVEYFTFKKGLVSDKIEKLGVKYRSRMFYDLILANHYNVVEHLHKRGYIVQTCHGIFSDMERPSFKADAYVAISYEVQEHLLGIGIKSHLFLNGVDCSRFYEQSKISTQLQTILSLSQSEKANDVIQEACLAQKVKFIKSNKFVENDYEIEKKINEADLVIGIGRSLYDAMACGRAVISFDHRKYGDAYGDGYLTKNNIEESILYNCSGRYSKKILTASDLVDEMQKYSAKDGAFFREFACKRLNIVNVTAEYLLLAPSNKKIFLKFCKLLTLVKHNVYWSVKIGLIKMKIINR